MADRGAHHPSLLSSFGPAAGGRPAPSRSAPPERRAAQWASTTDNAKFAQYRRSLHADRDAMQGGGAAGAAGAATRLPPRLAPLMVPASGGSRPLIRTVWQALEFFAEARDLPVTSVQVRPQLLHLQAELGQGYQPYDLLVVAKSKLQQQRVFYTMTEAGVCRVAPGEHSEFMPIDEWAKEANVYRTIVKIPFYRDYAVRKVFGVWRASVRFKLYCKAQAIIASVSLPLRPPFDEALGAARLLCDDMRRTPCVQTTLRRTYVLSELVDEQVAAQKAAKRSLKALSKQLAEQVSALCDSLQQTKQLAEDADPVTKLEMQLLGGASQVFDYGYQRVGGVSEAQTQRTERAKRRLGNLQPAAEVKTARATAALLPQFVRLADSQCVETLAAIPRRAAVQLLEFLRLHLAEVTQGMLVVEASMELSGVLFEPSRDEVLEAVQQIIQGAVACVTATKRPMASRFGASLGAVTSVVSLLADDAGFAQTSAEIVALFNDNFDRIDLYSESLEQFLEVWKYCTRFSAVEYEYQAHTADSLRRDLRKVAEWEQLVRRQMKVTKELGLVKVDTRGLKEELHPLVRGVQDEMRQRLHVLTQRFMDEAVREAEQLNESLQAEPQTALEYSAFTVSLGSGRSSLQANADLALDLHSLSKQQSSAADPGAESRYDDLTAAMYSMQASHDHGSVVAKSLLPTMQDKVKETHRVLCMSVDSIIEVLQEGGELLAEDADEQAVLGRLQDCELELSELIRELDACLDLEKLFEMEADEQAKTEVALEWFEYRQLFTTQILEWRELERLWLHTPFADLDTAELEEAIRAQMKAARRLFHLRQEQEVHSLLTTPIGQYEAWLPTLLNLGNVAMQHEHWDQVFEVLHMRGSADYDYLTLENLVEWGAFEMASAISQISGDASGEWALQESMRKLTQAMQTSVFSLTLKKGVPVLAQVDDLVSLLDDNQVMLQVMRSSRYVAGVIEELQEWESMLQHCREVVDEWLGVQRSWMYLHSVFTQPDIQRQLPSETRTFRKVDKRWREFMMQTQKDPRVLTCVSAPSVLEMFVECSKLLEQIRHTLDDYLEMKRAAFPRLYFLSDDELVEILSQSAEPSAVQSFLHQLFEAIAVLEFEDSGPLDLGVGVAAILSAEGERVQLVETVDVSGRSVEEWLQSVDKTTQRTLQDCLAACYDSFRGKHDNDWRLQWPASCVLAVEQIVWQESVQAALATRPAEAELKGVRAVCDRQINAMARSVREDVSPLERACLEALLVLGVHNRDVVSVLIDERVTSPSDHEWVRQLKFRWDADFDTCSLSQGNQNFDYGYEYLGATSRLVITPLTERCYLTMTNALSLNLGGCLSGKAGTGKSETIKDLSKALSRQCIVFNCSDDLDHKILGRFLSGLAQAGALACFDEFNRIDVEVLSVVAQQVQTIQQALGAAVDCFVFEGREIALDSKFGTFVTLNPGYSGRVELPDNLAALFRPVSMMAPSARLIMQNVLFSQGFESSPIAAQKLICLFKMCEEQLSQQRHYDWGLRAMKATLAVAAVRKQADPSGDEAVILYRSFHEGNVPKLVPADVTLFMSLLTDLFPTLAVPASDSHARLRHKAEAHLQQQCLRVSTPFLEKVLQLYDCLVQRHGVMLVGDTGTGKSLAMQTVAAALEEKPFQQTINPKAVATGQLFGQFHALSHEWTDGLLPAAIRRATANTDPGWKWIAFDGPVDPLWVENLNTVLDSTKTLCLSSGERMRMPDSFRFMFEVEDLAAATPATVSRCGMLYLGGDLHWRSVAMAWVLRHQGEQYISGTHLEMLPAFIDSTVVPTLSFVQTECQAVLPSLGSSRVTAFLELLDVMLAPTRVEVWAAQLQSHDLDRKHTGDALLRGKEMFHNIVGFAYVWSFGSNLLPASRKRFDEYARKVLTKLCPKFPRRGSVFDHYLDFESFEFRQWTDLVRPASKGHGSLRDMFVPTVSTERTRYLLSVLAAKGQFNVVLAGQCGVGKTHVVNEVVEVMATAGCSFSRAPLSAISSAKQLSGHLEQDMESGKGVLIPARAKGRHILVVDDLNLPLPDEYGTRGCLELLRQCVDAGGLHDCKSNEWMQLRNTSVMSTCTTARNGQADIPRRLLRHLFVLDMNFYDDADLGYIATSILSEWATADSAPRWLQPLIAPTCDACVAVYGAVQRKLKPTPSAPFYDFNLRDLLQAVLGVTQADVSQLQGKRAYLQLWCHEQTSVFAGRIVHSREQDWATDLMRTQLEEHFDVTWPAEDVASGVCVDFAGGFDSDAAYAPLADFEAARLLLSEMTHEQGDFVDFVFFDEAVHAITALCRALSQPRGHQILLTAGGCGRKNLIALSAHIKQMDAMSIVLGRQYGTADWHEDLKRVIAVACKKPAVFSVTNAQLTSDQFVVDLASLMETGSVPGLLAAEELKMMCSSASIAGADNLVLSSELSKRVQRNLHVVLAMDPSSANFNYRMLNFPALLSSCSMQYLAPWQHNPLMQVARHHIIGRAAGASMASAETLVRLCVEIHLSASKAAALLRAESGRCMYVTPAMHVSTVALFKSMLLVNERKISASVTRLRGGLDKLTKCSTIVSELQIALAEDLPRLATAADDTAALLVVIAADQQKADASRANVVREQVAVEEQSEACEALAREAQLDLAKAEPGYQRAVRALKSLNQSDIVEVKSFKKPPAMVVKVMESICVVRGLEPTWAQSVRLLSDTKFLQQLQAFDKDSVGPELESALREYTDDPKFKPSRMEKVSKACTSLCMWVNAIVNYTAVRRAIAPKRQRLATASSELEHVQALLAAKVAERDRILQGVADLRARYDQQISERDKLEQQMQSTKTHVTRAAKLLGQLSDEKTRWENGVERFEMDRLKVQGDTLLSAAFIMYAGPFEATRRARLLRSWRQAAAKLQLDTSSDFSVQYTIGDPVVMQDWKRQSLPQDSFSTDNAIIVTQSPRWPLLIDPQEQASLWIKAMLAKRGLVCVSARDPKLVQQLENAVRIGVPCMIEDAEETLDVAIRPVLAKRMRRVAGRMVVRLGDVDVDYNDEFRLFVASKMSNPHWSADLQTIMAVVDFAVTRPSLEEQLLTLALQHEMPHVGKQKAVLDNQIRDNQAQLAEVEDAVLTMLAKASGNILDDDALISSLKSSKETATEVGLQLGLAQTAANKLLAARAQYQGLGLRASLLFFCVDGLRHINPMYQYSLAFFRSQFTDCINTAPETDEGSERTPELIEAVTWQIFAQVCRGLSEPDRLLFAFSIVTTVLRARRDVKGDEWEIWSRGAPPLAADQIEPNPCSAWLQQDCWEAICALGACGSGTPFKGIAVEIAQNSAQWQRHYHRLDMYAAALPMATVFTPFQTLLVNRCLNPDLLAAGIAKFVSSELGSRFTESQPFDLMACYRESRAATPIMFVLSKGVDPMGLLQKFSTDSGQGKHLTVVSLGRGQGLAASTAVEKAMTDGSWVCLQNCHLYASWLPELRDVVEKLRTSDVHPSFRLWLTSDRLGSMPSFVLHNSIKITLPGAQGVRANLLRSLSLLPADVMRPDTATATKKAAFGLAMFHSVLQQRGQFGRAGLNASYDWTSADFSIALTAVAAAQLLLEKNAFESLHRSVGEIVYGGRVTDSWDQRCAMALLRKYIDPDQCTSSGDYVTDGLQFDLSSLAALVDQVKGMPVEDDPRMFGLSEDARHLAAGVQSRLLVAKLDELRPRAPASTDDASELSGDDFSVLEMCYVLTPDVPKDVRALSDSGRQYAYETLLAQEIDSANRLLAVMRETIAALQKTIRGERRTTPSLTNMYEALLLRSVPNAWAVYPSGISSLGAWIKELGARIAQLRAWQEAPQSKLNIGYLFHPRGLFAAVMKAHAQANGVPIDEIEVVITMAEASEIAAGPKAGVHIHGLQLLGAGWDADSACLGESLPQKDKCAAPVLHARAELISRDSAQQTTRFYACPIFRTPARAEIVATALLATADGDAARFVLFGACLTC